MQAGSSSSHPFVDETILKKCILTVKELFRDRFVYTLDDDILESCAIIKGFLKNDLKILSKNKSYIAAIGAILQGFGALEIGSNTDAQTAYIDACDKSKNSFREVGGNEKFVAAKLLVIATINR